jgi:hypothetical protein
MRKTEGCIAGDLATAFFTSPITSEYRHNFLWSENIEVFFLSDL